MVHAGVPIGAGLIASLARPGGNVTGTTNLSYAGKQIGLVRELVPRTVKLAILLNPSNANAHRYITDAIEAGSKFNISISVTEVARAEDVPNAFAMILEMRPDALLVMGDPFVGEHRAEVFAFAVGARLNPGSATDTIADIRFSLRLASLWLAGPCMRPEQYVGG